MKTLGIVVACVVLGYFAMLAMPMVFMGLGVAEYTAHAWYCTRTGGHLEHLPWKEGDVDVHEHCVYP